MTRPATSPELRLYAGAALISLSPVWVELTNVSPTTSAFYRVAFGGVALALYLFARRRKVDFARGTWWMLFVAAVFFSLDLWFWHRSIRYIGPGLSTLLANFQVFLLMFAGIVLYGQRPHAAQLVAVPLALGGLGLIIGLDWQALSPDYRLGVVFGLLTALAYGSYLLTMRALRDKSDRRLPVREIAVMSLLSTALLGGSAFVEGASLAIPTAADAGWLLAYGVLSHGLGMIFITSALPQVTTTQAGIALLLQPALSFLWDALFFGRPFTATQLAGAALALFAIWLGAGRRTQ
ncbi:MAG TPA: DMT family transporter [Woeseiaceae bacterium]|nr:DMT family transporter [Woeseiaceae bacterium]